MKSETQQMLYRLAEEKRNKECCEDILCPYCKNAQDNETKFSHVSYWGEDSLELIKCEFCQKDFYVKEKVTREFETTTKEYGDKESGELA
jgi:C4-type Zn-finger protein